MRIQQWPVDPNVSALLLAVGVLLVYWELCRPGMVIPGVTGLLVALLAAVKLAVSPRHGLRWWWAAALLFTVAAISWWLGSAALQGYLRKRRL